MSSEAVEIRDAAGSYVLQAEQAVPPGYKRTEVGAIPEDWEVCTLGDVLILQRGFDLPTRLRKEGNVPIISSSGISGWHNAAKASGPGIVTGRYGTIGDVFFVESDYWPLNTTLYVRDFRGNDRRYIFYLLQQVDFLSHSGKSGVPGVNRNDVHQELVLLPPVKEQRAIATALSDVDALITALDKLIAKKRAIKTAAMQQLLTGKTRLPGFSGEWETKRLGELGEVSGAGVDKKIIEGERIVRLLNYMDVYRSNVIRLSTLTQFVTAPENKAVQCAIKEGDIFFTPTSETPDDIAHSAVAAEDIADGVYSYHLVRLRIKQDIDLMFRAYMFSTEKFRRQAQTYAEGSGTRYVITLPKFRNMMVTIPKEKEEQTAIAQVLSDMDAEIAALEARRDKTRAIKQGMMQQLLTGRVRLVKPNSRETA